MPNLGAGSRHVFIDALAKSELHAGHGRASDDCSAGQREPGVMAAGSHGRLPHARHARMASDLHHVHRSAGNRHLPTYGTSDGAADAHALHHADADADAAAHEFAVADTTAGADPAAVIRYAVGNAVRISAGEPRCSVQSESFRGECAQAPSRVQRR